MGDFVRRRLNACPPAHTDSRQKPAKEDKDSLGCARGWSRDYMFKKQKPYGLRKGLLRCSYVPNRHHRMQNQHKTGTFLAPTPRGGPDYVSTMRRLIAWTVQSGWRERPGEPVRPAGVHCYYEASNSINAGLQNMLHLHEKASRISFSARGFEIGHARRGVQFCSEDSSSGKKVASAERKPVRK